MDIIILSIILLSLICILCFIRIIKVIILIIDDKITEKKISKAIENLQTSVKKG